jgi:hypothetical protein
MQTMTQETYQKDEIPLFELEKIGLAKNGRLNLHEEDIRALLSGSRTGMLRMENLIADGVHIEALDAKLSLKQGEQGKLDLLVHPIYRRPEYPSFLTASDAEKLVKGEVANINQVIFEEDRKQKDLLVEFDKDTNEFIITDTARILVPDMVNSEYLSPEQKERYRKGKTVELADGTQFQYTATDRHGIRSDKLALIASILMDGGLSYVLFKGLNAMFNKKRDDKAAAQNGKGYNLAYENMQAHERVKNGQQQAPKDEQERGYTRTGRSR